MAPSSSANHAQNALAKLLESEERHEAEINDYPSDISSKEEDQIDQDSPKLDEFFCYQWQPNFAQNDSFQPTSI